MLSSKGLETKKQSCFVWVFVFVSLLRCLCNGGLCACEPVSMSLFLYLCLCNGVCACEPVSGIPGRPCCQRTRTAPANRSPHKNTFLDTFFKIHTNTNTRTAPANRSGSPSVPRWKTPGLVLSQDQLPQVQNSSPSRRSTSSACSELAVLGVESPVQVTRQRRM